VSCLAADLFEVDLDAGHCGLVGDDLGNTLPGDDLVEGAFDVPVPLLEPDDGRQSRVEVEVDFVDEHPVVVGGVDEFHLEHLPIVTGRSLRVQS